MITYVVVSGLEVAEGIVRPSLASRMGSARPSSTTADYTCNRWGARGAQDQTSSDNPSIPAGLRTREGQMLGNDGGMTHCIRPMSWASGIRRRGAQIEVGGIAAGIDDAPIIGNV